jgi:hypothetical protein
MVPADLGPVFFSVNGNYDAPAPYYVVAFAPYYFGSDCDVFHGFVV